MLIGSIYERKSECRILYKYSVQKKSTRKSWSYFIIRTKEQAMELAKTFQLNRVKEISKTILIGKVTSARNRIYYRWRQNKKLRIKSWIFTEEMTKEEAMKLAEDYQKAISREMYEETIMKLTAEL